MKSKLLSVFFISLYLQSFSQNLIHFGIVNTVSNHELRIKQEVERYNNDTLIYNIKIEGDTTYLTSHQLAVTLCNNWYPYQCKTDTFTFDGCLKSFFINTQEMYEELQISSELVIASAHKKTWINYYKFIPSTLTHPNIKRTLTNSATQCIQIDIERYNYMLYLETKDLFQQFEKDFQP